MRSFGGGLAKLGEKATKKISSSPAAPSSGAGGDDEKSNGPTEKWRIQGSASVVGSFRNLRGPSAQPSPQPSEQPTATSAPPPAYTASPLPSASPSSAYALPPAPVQPDGPGGMSNIPAVQAAPIYSGSSGTSPAPSGLGIHPSESSGYYEGAPTRFDHAPQESPVTPSRAHSEPERPTLESKKSSSSYLPFSKYQRGRNDPEEAPSTDHMLPDGSTTPRTAKRNEPQFKLKVPKQLRGMANLSELDIDFSGGDISIVSDAKKKARKEGLCTACSKIDFEQFGPGNASAQATEGEKLTRKLIFLDRILRKKKKESCHFCELIFDAIAENDPLQHPAIKDHLPKELVGMNFKQWAESLDWKQIVPGYKPPYPFGRSRDSVKLKQEVKDQDVIVEGTPDTEQLAADDAAKYASVAAVGTVNVAMWQETDTERVKIMATVATVIPTVTSLMTNLDAKLPVAVSIIIHNTNDADAGLLNVDVWGYGNAHRAPLSRISTFNLRIASSYQPSLDGKSLSYGKLLGPEIDVEGDCKLWLENCSQHHGQHCDEPSWWNELPSPSGPHFRLIDVNEMRVVQRDVHDLTHNSTPRYAALSYVWGAAGKQCLNLHMRNLQDLSTHLDGQPLPIAKTIRDAIEVTRRMGLQYIWVDSLCIVQYDERGEDDAEARASQIEQMDRIFGHAAITIVAAEGLDAEAGLPGISSRPLRTQIARRVQPYVNVLLAVQYDNAYGKWDTRAWTLQEKLLSKRMLIFNGGYVSFHCRHGVLREDMPASHAGNGPAQIPWLSLPDKQPTSMIKRAWDGTPVLLRSPFFSEYANLLVQYTSRDMSNSMDALNAVLGLLKVLEKMTKTDKFVHVGEAEHTTTPTDYTLHGLPEKFLDLGLLWQPPATKGIHLTKRAHDDLPSWSWTGWEVSKDPEFDPAKANVFHAKPGVRFEEPFCVATHDDLSLKKVIAADDETKQSVVGDNKGTDQAQEHSLPEERFKPLVMWYKCLRAPVSPVMKRYSQSTAGDAAAPPTLIPVNGHGMGLTLGPADADILRIFRNEAITLRTQSSPPIDPGPPFIKSDIPIDSRHLVCSTQVAGFRIRDPAPRHETLWKRADKGLAVDTELVIREASIVDASDRVVGRVIPTDPRKGLASGPYDFILLSESQYWGNEKRVDVSGLPLYNVMFVEWDTRREFATRVGLGKIEKEAWWAAKPALKTVILK